MQLLSAANPQTSCVADAGVDQTLNIGISNQSVLLDANASTSTTGSIVSYKWYNGSTYLGSGVSRWYSPAIGLQAIRLVIETDDNCTNEVVTNITAVNTLHANAGQDLTLTVSPSNPSSVTLDGTASTAGANAEGIFSYEWFYNGDSLGTGQTLIVTPPGVDAEYLVTLEITDAAGDTDTDTVLVKVSVLAEDPIVLLKADAGTDITLNVAPSNRAVHLDGSNSFAVNGIVSYTWYDNNVYIGPGVARWYAPVASGIHDIKLVIMDVQGNSHTDHMNLNVVSPPQ